MPSKLPIITFRLTEEENAKFKYIAKFNNRKINDELKMITQKHINEFENTYGQLITDENGQVILAKPRLEGKSFNSQKSG